MNYPEAGDLLAYHYWAREACSTSDALRAKLTPHRRKRETLSPVSKVTRQIPDCAPTLADGSTTKSGYARTGRSSWQSPGLADNVDVLLPAFFLPEKE